MFFLKSLLFILCVFNLTVPNSWASFVCGNEGAWPDIKESPALSSQHISPETHSLVSEGSITEFSLRKLSIENFSVVFLVEMRELERKTFPINSTVKDIKAYFSLQHALTGEFVLCDISRGVLAEDSLVYQNSASVGVAVCCMESVDAENLQRVVPEKNTLNCVLQYCFEEEPNTVHTVGIGEDKILQDFAEIIAQKSECSTEDVQFFLENKLLPFETVVSEFSRGVLVVRISEAY